MDRWSGAEKSPLVMNCSHDARRVETPPSFNMAISHGIRAWWTSCTRGWWKVTMQVHEIMTTPPVTCTPETSLGVAAGRMADHPCGILPVVDTRGRLAGIITDRDICLAMSRTNRNALSISVREVMTRKVSSVQLGDDVRRALALMRTARVRRVPVLDAAGHLEGVLSIDDIIGRGPLGDIRADEIVGTLRDVYVRRSRAA